jgi:3-oxoacyl-[acyl-carrier-protein] synthase III
MNSALQIMGYGAWNGGTLTDNSMYENKGMFFKNDIPVTHETILERIGIRTRMVAPEDVRIGTIAIEDLVKNNDFDPARVKIIIGATNVGDDKFDPGPLIRYPFDIVKDKCPSATAFDLYAGCPGYNVSVELLLMLSLTGYLEQGDISIVVGAENIHRCKAFKPENTSNIIFGDDSLATALETMCRVDLPESNIETRSFQGSLKPDFTEQLSQLAGIVYDLNGTDKIDGILMDNKLGVLPQRVPATASRLQHSLMLRMHPDKADQAIGFKDLLALYDDHVDSFAFDINSLNDDPELVKTFAQAYIRAGKQRNMVSVYLRQDYSVEVTVHKGESFVFNRPEKGIVDARTRTHGCFASYIQAVSRDGELFGEMDGKGVFLYATRGARNHIEALLGDNSLSMKKLDLLIEHQANFAMLPLTLGQVLANGQPNLKEDVMDYLANKMITNIQERGNCSVVCMQRLPYDLAKGALKADTINGFPINRNLEALQSAKIILNDSVGAGMTRSSFLQRV